jgi:hypothetical protein
MKHHCHATGCTHPVPPKLFMCRNHWYSLPKDMRDRIWKTYRRGQEIDKRPSAEYLEASRAAIKFIEEREGRQTVLEL